MLIGFLLALSSSQVSASGISSLELLESSVDADFDSCIEFEVKGACEWIKCSLFGCSFDTTTIVQHYTPDVVVSVYDVIGNSPYSETDFLTRPISSLMGSESAGGEHGFGNKPSHVVARHVDIYGSYASIGLTSVLSNLPLGLSCQPGSFPLEPYFVSSFNPFVWYTGFIDSLMNMDQLLSNREVNERADGDQGSLISFAPSWGNIFPRTGMVVSQDHYRASAVFAARAMDILLNGNNYGHYKVSLEGRKDDYYMPSEKFEEWSSYEGRFQMVYPKYEDTCHILGDKSIKTAGLDGWGDRRSSNGDYAWQYWRRYKCCKKPGGYSMLFKVEW